jgi:hypothetical protein
MLLSNPDNAFEQLLARVIMPGFLPGISQNFIEKLQNNVKITSFSAKNRRFYL